MKNLVMGFGTNQTRDSLEVFLRSAREVWSRDEVDICLVTNSKNGIEDIIAESGAFIFPTSNTYSRINERKSISNKILMRSLCALSNLEFIRDKDFLNGYYSILETLLHPHLARWYAYKRMLEVYDGYGSVILSDVRDVQFQDDLFGQGHDNGVNVFQEGGGFSPETCNGKWYIDAYGERSYGKVRDNSPICVGVIWGNVKSVRAMIDRLCLEIAKSPFGKIEQAIFNHHFFHKAFADDVRSRPNVLSGVANLSCVEEYQPMIEVVDDRVCLRGGAVIPVIHMYDRDAAIQALVNRRYGLSA